MNINNVECELHNLSQKLLHEFVYNWMWITQFIAEKVAVFFIIEKQIRIKIMEFMDVINDGKYYWISFYNHTNAIN